MKKNRVKIFLSADRDRLFEIAKEVGLAPGSEAERLFSYTCCEVAVILDVDLKTGGSKVIAISVDGDVL